MMRTPRPRQLGACVLVGLLITAGTFAGVRAQDHNDGNGTFPGWDLGGRRDANITYFFAFLSPLLPDRLVLILGLNQGILDPEYRFASDLTVRFHVDNHSSVVFTDGDPQSTTDDWMMRFGGTVVSPEKISPDIVFEVTFPSTPDGRSVPRLGIEGISGPHVRDSIRLFPDAQESPVRRLGIAWVALEIPLGLVVTPDDPTRPLQDTLLLWATTKVPEVHGAIADHIGMPNTSSLQGNLLINRLRPRNQPPLITQYPADLFLIPLPDNPVNLAPYADVLIFDLSRQARGFPPGRGNPNLPPPPGFVQFDPFDPSRFPNGHPVSAGFDNVPFTFPYIAQ